MRSRSPPPAGLMAVYSFDACLGLLRLYASRHHLESYERPLLDPGNHEGIAIVFGAPNFARYANEYLMEHCQRAGHPRRNGAGLNSQIRQPRSTVTCRIDRTNITTL